MTAVQLLAALKSAIYFVPLALLLRTAKWRWLIGALVLGAIGNVSTAFGANRLTTSVIGIAFLVLLIAHAFDISRFTKPDR